ncbi:sulfotransferase family protein [Phaeobacter sp. J2-8]|uniref:sulfotransferase family protein n=1 Tax=Phaeobacter sp. J2-8 TaxID=2931394 RepID=UPI001FD4352F|nr:sulfotransferase family protein [Phaeobacter sp. J2-8]MCJ7872392.1 sulfotransferase family protein [Phaeobacter sp. J2-8]
MSRLRVINLGLPKSGTTTLARALRKAGLHVADHRIRPRQTDNTDLHGRFVGQMMYDGYFLQGDPLTGLDEFDAFAEVNALRGEKSIWPQFDFGLIDAIRGHHPGARFLASWRAPADISHSMLRWSNLGTERIPAADIPGLPAGYGVTTQERVTWITGHYAALDRFFAGASDFLLYDVANPDAAAQIGAFLGRELPWWGRTNVNPVKHPPVEDLHP